MRADLARRLKSGERIAGFGHPIYPGGDPRYPILLRELHAAAPNSPELEFSVQLTEEVDGLIGVAANIDFGLASLGLVLGLAPGSAITLFALGRTVGWIGQAMEQIADGGMIRPRARYVGPAVRS